MTHIVTHACFGVKDTACVDVCPVDCIYGAKDASAPMVYIHPEECIDCGACVDACPVEAIWPQEDLPANYADRLLKDVRGYLSLPPAPETPQTREEEAAWQRRTAEEQDRKARERAKANLVVVDETNLQTLAAASSERKSELAFYFPDYWPTRGSMMNFLMFFDGIALLVPRERQHRLPDHDPELFEQIQDAGVLRVIDPARVVDRRATELLASAVVTALDAGLITRPSSADDRYYSFISGSRIGFAGDTELAQWILDELRSRRLAAPSPANPGFIAMDREAYELVLFSLAHILSSLSIDPNAVLHPVTDRPGVVSRMRRLVQLRNGLAPSETAELISFDAQVVGVDLASVPLSEVLAFRREHLLEFRSYARSVRQAARDIALLSPEERERAFADREEELSDLAAELRRVSRKAWGRPASLMLSLAGAFWSAYSGDPLAAILAGGAALASELSGGGAPPDPGIYSYLLEASRAFGGRF